MKLITKNKKAFFEYEVLDRLEAGLVLTGAEVKSLRTGQCSLNGSYAVFNKGELFLLNSNIPAYSHSGDKANDEPLKNRKLLLHKKELARLVGEVARQGVTLVPLSLYFNKKSLVKLELGICKHRKAAGKKQVLKERDIKRETAKELKDIFGYK